MKILYFILGLSPQRSGGMSVYVSDLIREMAIEHEVAILYPGTSSLLKKKQTKIIDKGFDEKNIRMFELLNSTPIPLLSGVKNPDKLLFESRLELSYEDINNFYDAFSPDVFHIHTLMGVPHEIIPFFQSKNVYSIFTPHDYYGICPKVNFINQNGLYCKNRNSMNCSLCNLGAPSIPYLKLRNNPTLLSVKGCIAPFRKNNKFISKYRSDKEDIVSINKEIDYNSFFVYYQKIIEKMDLIHFNSYITLDVFNRFIDFKEIPYKVLPVIHKGISDNRSDKKYNPLNIRFGYIGSLAAYKGFSVLYDVLNTIRSNCLDKQIELVVWGAKEVSGISSLVTFKGKYNSRRIKEVFESFDILIVPSIWKETLSLVSLEAISYGVPVIMSSNVGAKFILENFGLSSFVYESTNELENLLTKIIAEPSILSNYNRELLKVNFEYVFSKHIQLIKKEIYCIE